MGRGVIRSVLVGALALTALLPARARAQTQDCEFSAGSDITEEVRVMGGITYLTRPRMTCDGGRMTVRADRAEIYESVRRYVFYGNTVINNADVRLTAQDAQYEAGNKHITAQAAPRIPARIVKKADSTQVSGQAIDYYEAGGGSPQEQLTVTWVPGPNVPDSLRPHAIFKPKPSPSAPPDTLGAYDVNADRIFIIGEDLDATGKATILRGKDEIAGEHIHYFSAGQMQITGTARLKGEKYDLSGDEIIVFMPNNEISEVTMKGNGELISDKLTLSSASIRMALTDGTLNRVSAGPNREVPIPGRPQPPPPNPADPTTNPAAAVTGQPGAAVAQPGAAIPPPGGATLPGAPPAAPLLAVLMTDQFNVRADSLEIVAPGERLDTLLAMGRANITMLPQDTLERKELPPVARKDWIEGDTVFAVFARTDSSTSPMPADSAAGDDQQLESLRAWGKPARALYLMDPADTTAAREGKRAISYLRADTIDVAFDDQGEVATLQGTGNVDGQEFEPAQSAPRNDSSPPNPPPVGAPAIGAPTPTGGQTSPPGAAVPNPGTPAPSPRPPLKGPEPHR